jgi:hypothetical protein
MLESIATFAYARVVSSNPPIRPLHDVWLRPRRVFRELASQPVGVLDLLLGAVQGIVGTLGYFRALNFGAKASLGETFLRSTIAGSVLGIASLYLMAAIYSALASRAGRPGLRRPALHVLAYGGVPSTVSLGVWVVIALLAGPVTFMREPQGVDDFEAPLLALQFASDVLLLFWSVVLQVMGLSEIMAVSNGKAFGIWVVGKLVGVLAMLILYVLAAPLIPLDALLKP